MKFRHVTAASVFAAMAALAGCGQDETTTAEDTYTYDEEVDQTAQETQPFEDTENMEAEPFEETEEMQDDTGLAGSVDRSEQPEAGGMTDTLPEESTQMTEFAALDTNSDGSIDEQEWQPDAVQGTQFEEVDQNGDGMVDRDEFSQGVAMSDTGGTTGTSQDEMPEEGTQQ